MDKELRKKCVKFVNPDENDSSMKDPFIYDPTYMGCDENFCESAEECKKRKEEGEGLADGQKTTRKTVPKIP